MPSMHFSQESALAPRRDSLRGLLDLPKKIASAGRTGSDSLSSNDSFLGLTTSFSSSDLHISVDNHYASKTYTNGSHITGTVTFSPRKDTTLDGLRISFVGMERVKREDMPYGGSSVAKHVFFDTVMPVPDAEAEARTLSAGESYAVPFHFVVPGYLVNHACAHKTASPAVKDHHSRLPPSTNSWMREDLCPTPCRIEYAIRAVALATPSRSSSSSSSSGRGPKCPVQTKSSTRFIVNVLPSYPEDAPITPAETDLQYTTRQTKSFRSKKSRLAAEGRITASAAQPRAIVIGPDGLGSSESEILISLDYQPFGGPEAAAPQMPPSAVTGLGARLKSQTWFRTQPNSDFPDRGVSRDAYSHSNTLVSKLNTDASWEPYPALGEKHDSEDGTPYSAVLLVPFRLPSSSKNKIFLPTFHSCLTSRTYKVDVSLTVAGCSFNLCVPLQVVVQPSEEQVLAGMAAYSLDDDPAELEARMFTAALEGDSAAEYWRQDGARRSSTDNLPDYPDYA